MAERFPWPKPLEKVSQHHTSQFSSLDYQRAVELQELSPVVQSVARKKVVALLPSRRGARSSPSLQDSFSGRVRSPPIASGIMSVCLVSSSLQNSNCYYITNKTQTAMHDIFAGHFLDLQSPAYELAEYPHEQRPENDAFGYANSLPSSLTEKPYSKVRSGWTSIRPHLISSQLGAGKGSVCANEIQISTLASSVRSTSPQNQTLNGKSFANQFNTNVTLCTFWFIHENM